MHSVWAVATNTIKQALRMKIAAVFIILMIVLLPVMGMAMTGDGTLKGRLQTFVSYSLSLTSFLLCLLTIMASVYTLTSDISQGQIFTVLTKPVRRFQLIFGKLLGIILLDVILLALFSAVIYSIAVYTPKFLNASEDERTRVNNEFFTARASLTPVEGDIDREVQETYKKLEKEDRLPPGVVGNKIGYRNFIKTLTKQIRVRRGAVEVGHDLLWEFENVKPLDPKQSLFVRFKFEASVNPADAGVFGRWVVGDDRQIRDATGIKTPIYTFDRKDLIRTFHEIEVPADAVAQDGYLVVGFLNVPLNSTVVIFPPEEGLEVLYKADTFTANFARAVLLILIRLVFLACLGMLAATFLSFPVAILLCLAVFFTGTISGFCLESFDFLSENVSSFYYYTFRPVVQLLPQFDKFNPAKFLVPARLLSWFLLAKAAGSMICIRAALLLLLALLIFSFREIAKVII